MGKTRIETSTQRKRRLAKEREKRQLKKLQESPTSRAARLAKKRQAEKERRRAESPTSRAARLAKAKPFIKPSIVLKMAQKEKRKSAVYEFFTISEDKKFNICKVPKLNANAPCGMKISTAAGDGKRSSTRASNLKRHLQRHHPGIMQMLIDRNEELKRQLELEAQSCSSQPHENKVMVKDKVTVPMTQDKFKRCIMDMVVKCAIPISLFSSAAFVALNGTMALKFGISLERNSIKIMLLDEAKRKKDALKELIHQQFVHVKIDLCTHKKVHYFTVNVQFIDDRKEVVMRTLAVRYTEAQLTAEYIQMLVMSILDEFDIAKTYVLSIVGDNASSMKSSIEKMNKDDMEVNFDNDEILENDDDIDAVDELVASSARLMNITHMRCAAHTLNLALLDGLLKSHSAGLIGKLRNIVSAARAPKYDALLKKLTGKSVISDRITCWGSTFLMMQRVLELKPYLKHMLEKPDETLSDAEWEEVKELEALLRYPYAVTKTLQSADLTPGIFYKEWKSLMFCLSQIGGTTANDIMNSMICREHLLLDNGILLAAVYVDPVYQVTLTEEQSNVAKDTLCKVAIQMELLPQDGGASHRLADGSSAPADVDCDHAIERCSDGPGRGKHNPLNPEGAFSGLTDGNPTPTLAPTGSISTPSDIDCDQAVERCSDDQELAKHDPLNPEGEFKLEFNTALNEVEKIDSSSKVNVKEAILGYPLIVQNAALNVTALPTTQGSVERLFSALQIIRSDFRSSMEEDIFQAVLFLRANSM